MKSCFLFLAFLLFGGEGVAQPQLELVADINPMGSGDPKNFIPGLGKLFFNANYQDSIGLWRPGGLYVTDGTQAGTQLLSIANIATHNDVHDLGVYSLEHNGKLYLRGQGLIVTDGSVAGTSQIAHVGGISGMVVYQDKVFFSGGDSAHGYELWKTDGTAAGTTLVADVCPGTCSGLSKELAVVGDRIFFSGGNHTEFQTGRRHLWSSKGTAATTKKFKTIAHRDGNYGPQVFTVYNGKLLFNADSGSSKVKLMPWVCDGTWAGTHPVFPDTTMVDKAMFMFHYMPLGNKLGVWVTPSFNSVFYMTDGTDTGTHLIPGIRSDNDFKVYAGSQFFYADTPFARIMVSDGTASGTHPIVSPSGHWLRGIVSRQNQMIAHDGKLVMATRDSVCGVWETDGTVAGTRHIRTYNPALGAGGSNAWRKELVSFNGIVYLPARLDSAIGNELYRINPNPTSVSSLSKKKEPLTIIPNPATNTITIHTPKAEAAIITDLSGRVVLRAMLGAGRSVDVSALSPGMYLVKMASGGAGRFVKE